MADLRLADFNIGYTQQAFHLRVKVEDIGYVQVSFAWLVARRH